METTIFEVKLIDGRIFRIFCANSTQKKKFINSISEMKHFKPYVSEITNGIHTLRQWNSIIKTLTK